VLHVKRRLRFSTRRGNVDEIYNILMDRTTATAYTLYKLSANYSWHLFFGGIPLPPKKLTISPETAAELCALNAFYGPRQ